MQIIKLTLNNFKGIKHFSFDTDRLNISIFADNAVGKTTVADAFYWCLFGKDSQGSSTFEIKTLGEDGQPIHGLDHSVELVLGDTTFKRTYKEVWSGVRGTLSSKMSHTTDYSINGVSSVCPEPVFRLLTQDSYFASIKWQDRRKMLMDVFCAEITDEVVISSNDKLEDLPRVLNGRTVEDYGKIAKAKHKEINEQLKSLPARIDEADRNMPELVDVPGGADGIRQQLNEAHKQIAELNAGGGAAQFSVDIARAKAAIESYEAARIREYDNANASQVNHLNALRSEMASSNRLYTQLQSILEADNKTYVRNDIHLENLRDRLRNLKALSYAGDDTCPTCGQDIQADKVEAAVAAFNQKKAIDLNALIEEGKSLKNEQEAFAVKIAKQSQEMADLNAKIDQYKLEINQSKTPAPFVLDTAAMDYCALKDKLARLENEQIAVQSGNKDKVAEIEAKIVSLQGQLDEIGRAQQVNAQRADLEKRKAELMSLQQMYCAHFEEYAAHLNLLEEFIRTKVSMVTSKINDQFEMAKFTLFETQINEGIKECCEITYNGVPWGSLNNGARVNVGLDIINTFTKNGEVGWCEGGMPIFIDNAESVTAIRPTIGQQIRLIVSAGDKELRVVKDIESTREALLSALKWS
jgi:hypothetical protein